jgi:hypothetical protein
MLSLAAFSPRGLDTWRQHSLFILFRDDDPSDREIAALVSRVLVERLPQSRAQPLAVSDLLQIGEFLLSRQFDIALVRTPDVAVLAGGGAARGDRGTETLVLLARFRDHLLICRADLPADHASMIAAALSDLTPKNFAGIVPPLAWHPAVNQ